MAVRFIIDSGSDLSMEQAQAMSVALVPMTIRFGDREFRAGIDLSNEEFYNLLTQTSELPTTSQPTPYDFEQVYQGVKAAGDEAVVLCVSSALSGTYQSACIAAEAFSDCIYVVDTKAVTVAQRLLLEYAMQLQAAGTSAKEIAHLIDEKKEYLCAYGAVESLEYLIRGGRLSKAAGTVGSMLGIRPVLRLADGKLEIAGKARGAKAAITLTHNLVNEVGIDYSMPYGLGYTGNDPDVLTPYLNAPNSSWNGRHINIYHVGSTVGTHAGPGLFLTAFFKKVQ